MTKLNFKSDAGLACKTVAFDCKAISEEGDFEGYASRFGVEDQGGDTVLAGAFKESLSKRGVGGIKMLAHHDRTNLIGVWSDLKENSDGLMAKGKLFLDDAEGQKIHIRMKAGALDGLSIGYRVQQEEITNPRTYARNLIKIDLFEISVVAFPMLESARVDAVKGAPMTEREFERMLTQDAKFTRSQARKIINEGYKSLAAKQDAGAGLSEILASAKKLTQNLEKSI